MSKYNEAMAHVAVSEEMKHRILDNLPSAETGSARIVRFPNAKRYIALAACFAVVLIGVLGVTLMNPQPQVGNDPSTGVLTAGEPVEYRSAKKLSAAAGIKIEELQNLPFEATGTVYLDYRTNLAEIRYSDGTQSLYYRASAGSTDPSGDNNEYETVRTKETHGLTVTLKGSGELVYCALYEKQGVSYSIGSSEGLTWQQIEALIP